MYSVQVAVRIRPLNPEELDNCCTPCVSVLAQQKSIIVSSGSEGRNKPLEFNYLSPRKPRRTSKIARTPDRSEAQLAGGAYAAPRAYTFDYCYDQDATQEEIFKLVGQNTLDNALAGYNASVFAYGQTGSGKTYTMLGTKGNEGLIPRICKELLVRMATENLQGNKCSLSASYLEIYNENCADLLREGKSSNLKVREHPVEGAFVEDLTVKPVSTLLDVEDILQAGHALRRVAQTKMNEKSSRSHAIFTVYFSKQTMEGETVTSKVNLVDLAGSERLEYSKIGNCRMKESANINTSLHQLGRVIRTLSERSEDVEGGDRENLPPNSSTNKAKRKRQRSVVPYRDSLLTWLLKPSLGGNSKTTMLITVSPTMQNYEETMTSLRYASMCKKIRNKVAINRHASKLESFDKLKAELERLREAGKRMNKALTMPQLENYHETIVKGVLCELLTAIEYEDMLETQERTFAGQLCQRDTSLNKLEAKLNSLNAENVELQLNFKTEKQKKKDLEDELQTSHKLLQVRATSFDQALASLTSKHAKYLKELKSTTTATIVQLEARVKALTEENSQLQEKLSECSQQIAKAALEQKDAGVSLQKVESTLLSERQKATAQQKHAQERYEILSDKNRSLEAMMVSSKANQAVTVRKLTHANKSLELQLQETQKELKKLKEVCKTEQEKSSERSKRVREAFVARIKENMQQLEEKEAMIAKLERRLQSHSQNENELIKAKSEMDRSAKFLAGMEALVQKKTT